MSLSRRVDETEEWLWNEWKPNAELDPTSRLPPWTGWTATLIDHTVYLIGGRRDKPEAISISIDALGALTTAGPTGRPWTSNGGNHLPVPSAFATRSRSNGHACAPIPQQGHT